MTVLEAYLAGLRSGLESDDREELARAHGATPADLDRLTARYPMCPPTLLELLSSVDGTHFRDYPAGEVALLMLGSYFHTMPYFLRSAQQIIQASSPTWWAPASTRT